MAGCGLHCHWVLRWTSQSILALGSETTAHKVAPEDITCCSKKKSQKSVILAEKTPRRISNRRFEGPMGATRVVHVLHFEYTPRCRFNDDRTQTPSPPPPSWASCNTHRVAARLPPPPPLAPSPGHLLAHLPPDRHLVCHCPNGYPPPPHQVQVLIKPSMLGAALLLAPGAWTLLHLWQPPPPPPPPPPCTHPTTLLLRVVDTPAPGAGGSAGKKKVFVPKFGLKSP